METTSKSILVVEDEADLREALKTVFIYEDFTVYTAPDGEEGIKTAFEKKPDIILLDVLMPKKDGVTVLKELRADEWGKSVKVIVLTALDDLEKVAEIIAAGGDDYIVKTNITLSAIAQKVKEKLAK
ncbi:response regulator [Candidatus Kaiserbacteria bacterium]|nr:MAG: response regulator [Candidatus Kaiserbacteria bacterium]